MAGCKLVCVATLRHPLEPQSSGNLIQILVEEDFRGIILRGKGDGNLLYQVVNTHAISNAKYLGFNGEPLQDLNLTWRLEYSSMGVLGIAVSVVAH